MTEQNPTYSKNKVASLFEHIGHDAHEVESFVVGDAIDLLRKGLTVAHDMEEQFPTLAQESATVVGDVLALKTLGLAVATSVAGGGANLAADAGVLAALVVDGPVLIQLFADAGKLAGTITQDIKTDAAVLNGKPATEQS